MKSSLFFAISLLAIRGPSLSFAQTIEEIDEGNGVYALGWEGCDASSFTPVQSSSSAAVVPAAPAPAVTPSPAPAPAPAPAAPAAPVVPAAPPKPSTTTTSTSSTSAAAAAVQPTTLVPIATGNKPVNEGVTPILTSSASRTAGAAAINTPAANDGCPASVSRFMTISVTNAWTTQLSVFLGSNAGAPTPIGNPQPTVLAAAAATSYVLPPCWAGRISFDPTGMSPLASKIEGSVGSAGVPAQNIPGTTELDVDISYVDGYTVPITCSSGGTAVTGCNLDLFAMNSCTGSNGVLSDDGTSCMNPTNNPVGNGPPTAFFAPCAGAAYTFPNDNNANDGSVDDVVTCCIGTKCAAPTRQGKAATKRDAEEEEAPRRARFLEAREKAGTSLAVRDPSAVASHLRAHKHRHGLKRSHLHHVS
ncbi:hypothetical protein MMC13_008058 [Lambiella insularis]|nr:hypothetical protein [Lambiella insularis]